MAAWYAQPDTRRVRIDVDDVDEAVDLDEEACASHLFDLRAHSPTTAAQRSTPAAPEDEDDGREERKEGGEGAGGSDRDGDAEERKEAVRGSEEMSHARRLLLTAVAQRVSGGELRLLYSLLSPAQRAEWRAVASAEQP